MKNYTIENEPVFSESIRMTEISDPVHAENINAANRGMPLQDVQMLAGHASPNMTMIYCTVDKSKVKAEHKMHLAS